MIEILIILVWFLIFLSYPAYLIWYNSYEPEQHKKMEMIHIFGPVPFVVGALIYVYENADRWSWIDVRNDRIAACEAGDTSKPCRVIAEDFKHGVTTICPKSGGRIGAAPTSGVCTLLKPDATKSLHFMKLACDRGDQTACYLSYLEVAARKDPQLSKIQEYCDSGSGLACEDVYETVKEQPNNSSENRRALLDVGCKDNRGFSCMILLQMDMLKILGNLRSENSNIASGLHSLNDIVSVTVAAQNIREKHPDYAYHYNKLINAYKKFNFEGIIGIRDITAVRHLANEVHAEVAAIEIPRLSEKFNAD